MDIEEQLRKIFPTFRYKKIIPTKSWWCRRGFHNQSGWQGNFGHGEAQITICRKCGVVIKEVYYFNIFDGSLLKERLGYIDPAEINNAEGKKLTF